MGRGEWEMREGKGEKKGGRRGAGPTTKKIVPAPLAPPSKNYSKMCRYYTEFRLKNTVLRWLCVLYARKKSPKNLTTHIKKPV